MPKAATSAVQKLTLRLPEPVVDTYLAQAARAGSTNVEAEMIKRLTIAQDYTATIPIYLGDAERNELSTIAGKLIQSPDDLMNWIRQLTTINVSGIRVELSNRLLARIESRRFGHSMEDHLKQVVTEQLETYVGLR